MKVKILKDGKEKEIICNSPKGRHTKKGLKLFTSIVKDDKEDLPALNKYLEYLDEVTAEMTGMSVEELDDLDTDEKNKLVSFYQKKVEERLDFLKSSSKLQDSPQSVKKVP